MVVIDSDPSRLDVAIVHDFLSRHAYWSLGRSRATVERALRHSLCFGAYEGEALVGFCRVVSDRATFAWLADVFVLPGRRGQGIARRLVEAALADPGLQGLRRWLLGTRDAHGLYRKLGFTDPAAGFLLEKLDPRGGL